MRKARFDIAVQVIGLSLALWAVLAASVASAAVTVVPGEVAAVEGNINNGFPFNIGDHGLASQRYQQVYAASAFAAFAEPVLITHLAFRPDAQTGHAFSFTIADIQINLSTTAMAPDALSLTFADNVGADDTVVFSGALPLSSAFTGPAAGPKNFDIVIALQTPFLYDPTAGNLLLDVRNFSGGSTAQFDAHQAGDAVSRVNTIAGDVNSPTADLGDSLGLVTQFRLTGPTTVALAIASARAEKLGTANAKVTIQGNMTDPSLADLDLGASTVAITSVVNEDGQELVARASLPRTLVTRPGSDADGATYETPTGARPKMRLDMTQRGGGRVDFRLVVEFAPSLKPAGCAGTPRTTEVTTSFQIDPDLFSATVTRPWQCLSGDGQLRVPVP
jgi:hypothetical protein